MGRSKRVRVAAVLAGAVTFLAVEDAALGASRKTTRKVVRKTTAPKKKTVARAATTTRGSTAAPVTTAPATGTSPSTTAAAAGASTAAPTIREPWETIGRPNTRAAAQRSVLDALERTADPGLEVSVLAGPSTPPSVVEGRMVGLKAAMRLWSPQFRPSKTTFVLFSANDLDWGRKTTEGVIGQPIPWWSNWAASCSPARCDIGTVFPAGSTAALLVVAHDLVNENPSYPPRLQTVPHEYTHSVQQQWGDSTRYPSWLFEGQAMFYGVTLGLAPDPDGSRAEEIVRSGITMRDQERARVGTIRTAQQWVDWLKENESQARLDSTVFFTSYWTGYIATEALVAVYGHDKVVELTKAIGQTGIDRATQQVLGMPKDDLYRKLAVYLQYRSTQWHGRPTLEG